MCSQCSGCLRRHGLRGNDCPSWSCFSSSSRWLWSTLESRSRCWLTKHFRRKFVDRSEITKKKGSGHLPSVLDRWKPFSQKWRLRHYQVSPSLAIHVTSLCAHISLLDYILWSSSCFHSADLLVVIVYSTWGIIPRDGGRGLILTGSPFSYSGTIDVPAVDNSGSSSNYCCINDLYLVCRWLPVWYFCDHRGRVSLARRVKNQRGHWVCWMSTSTKNGLM